MASADITAPIVDPRETATSITERICGIALEERAGRGWWIGFLCSLMLVGLLVVAVVHLLAVGLGIWGVQIPVAWGFAIINYVWWIAVASGGTLISAIFYVTRSAWRTSITRIAETMMLMAALCAAVFPIIHLGRPWYFYWLVPYPSMLGVYPQFRSPLLWDFFALLTYVFASVLFWYISLVPDLATMRDRSTTSGSRLFYGFLALGWRGSAEHWRHHKTVTLLFAGLLTPVVVSIHSVVGLDFAGGLTPGWHSTQFPHFFVFGAMLSGFATVLALVIPIRHVYRLQALITPRHLDILGKLLVVSSLAVGYAYLMEVFLPLYGTDPYEKATVMMRLAGVDAPAFWATVLCNVLIPQLFWLPAVRRMPLLAFCICPVIITGMWLERYVIVVTSLAHDFMPSAWQSFVPTFWDWATLAGTIGLFLAGILVFVRLLPVVSMSEMKAHLRPGERAVRRGSSGLILTFPTPEALCAATQRLRAAGFERLEALTPHPDERVQALFPSRRRAIPAIVLICGAVAVAGGLLMQYVPAAILYPTNIGNRPLASWPAFGPITFEIMALVAAIAAFFGFFAVSRLPMMDHPAFYAPDFARASQDRFILALEAADPAAARIGVERALEAEPPLALTELWL